MRLLVVEDQPRMASLIKRGLEEHGHSVDVANTGPDGVWMSTENDYRDQDFRASTKNQSN